ncbi:YhfX family PLP-dependent enzyme [Alkalihalobacillus sp. CinArs1]|uniref:YhfX family PLP-dependent enzyme n=1 Tax=Alkalihalobacillus sp. CinArs1 TaxID=2995314 RepID=UPI0022DE221C|nr:YhfX family PLP-dependent enzyme [Alkalihalobacillus sp. CinArs1]
MFLTLTKERNPELIKIGVNLHQTGELPPNTYVIDLDTVAENVEQMARAAEENEFSLYFMSKQLGRIGELGKWIAEHGIEKAVAVEFEEARRLHKSGVALGNVGHLVQPGKHQWKDVLSFNPEVVTVFTIERAKQVSDAAVRLGRKQDVLLRVVQDGDTIYPGQWGGFHLERIDEEILILQDLPGIEVVGITSFPLLLMDDDRGEMTFTKNLETLLNAKEKLESAGFTITQVNGPSATSTETIPMLKRAGITHGEPGHALTGTTPLHAVRTLPERPAIIYLSEVSHQDDDNVYVLGGGFYERGKVTGAYVGHNPETIFRTFLKEKPMPSEYIDYYGRLERGTPVSVGDTAVYAFRTQVFVTRANVALVRGLHSKNPEIVHLERRG